VLDGKTLFDARQLDVCPTYVVGRCLDFGSAMVYTVIRLTAKEVRDEKTRCAGPDVGRDFGGFAVLQWSTTCPHHNPTDAGATHVDAHAVFNPDSSYPDINTHIISNTHAHHCLPGGL
jgi:hypothetical protein